MLVSPIEGGLSFEEIRDSFKQGCFVQSLIWSKSVQWFWGRTLLNFVNVFSIFVIISPLERMMSLFWNKLHPLFPTDEKTEDGRQAIRKGHLSFQLIWVKNDPPPPKKNQTNQKRNWLILCGRKILNTWY